MKRWDALIPALATAAMVLAWGRDLNAWIFAFVVVLLAGTILASVQHAETVAHRVGEPFGSLVLAVAVTVLEAGMIIMLMTSGKPGTETLLRDTIFAAVMITTNIIVGVSLIVAGGRQSLAHFNAEGAGAALATVLVLAVSTLVLPNATSAPTGEFSGAQLAFAAVSSLGLWALFVVTQTTRHRGFFLPVDKHGDIMASDSEHEDMPTNAHVTRSAVMLLVSLMAVVGLAKIVSPAVEHGVRTAGLPQAFVGLVIAALILLPETLAAVRNARRARTQVALNLAYGSALATIGLTVPVLALLSAPLDLQLVLGLEPAHVVLLSLTAIVSMLTVVPGRATRLQGALHVVIAAFFVLLTALP